LAADALGDLHDKFMGPADVAALNRKVFAR
jgi:hypothetical protein